MVTVITTAAATTTLSTNSLFSFVKGVTLTWQNNAPGNDVPSSKEMSLLVFSLFSFLWCSIRILWGYCRGGRLWRKHSDLMVQLITLETNPPLGTEGAFSEKQFQLISLLKTCCINLVYSSGTNFKMHIMWAKTHRNDPLVQLISVLSYTGKNSLPSKKALLEKCSPWGWHYFT